MMKLMFIADIHGSEAAVSKALEIYRAQGCDRLVILGDILYHGARNDLPEGYNPKGVISVLNEQCDEIFAVRGNCDSEVDQMVLNFSCMSDYIIICENGRCFFVTHGHIYNKENPPKIKKGDFVIYGHTHVQGFCEENEINYINPGSISIPKGGNPPTLMIYEDGVFTIYDFDMNVINRREII